MYMHLAIITCLRTPANMNGTTTSPWRAKIQRTGLLNMTWMIAKNYISLTEGINA